MERGFFLDGGQDFSSLYTQQTHSEAAQENKRLDTIPEGPEPDAEAPATAPTPPAQEADGTTLAALAATNTNTTTSTNTTPSPPPPTPTLNPKQRFREEYLEKIKTFKVRICEDCLRVKWEGREVTRPTPRKRQPRIVTPPVRDLQAECACLRFLRQNGNMHLNILRRAAARRIERTEEKYEKVLRGMDMAVYPHTVDNSLMRAAQLQREEVYQQIMKDEFGFAPSREVFFLTFQKLYRKAVRESRDLWLYERRAEFVQGKIYEDALKVMREAEWGFCACGKLVDWKREYILGGTEEFGQLETGMQCLCCGAWQYFVTRLGLIKDALIRDMRCSVQGMRAMEDRLCNAPVPLMLDLQRSVPWGRGLFIPSTFANLNRYFSGGSNNGGRSGAVPGSQVAMASPQTVVPYRPNPLAPVFEANGASQAAPPSLAGDSSTVTPSTEAGGGGFVLNEAAFDEEEEMIGEILGRSRGT